MSGNVWEWTRSLWGKSYGEPDFRYPFKFDDGRENLEAPDDVLRVRRGGAFSINNRDVRCAVRRRRFPNVCRWSYGFRVAVRPYR